MTTKIENAVAAVQDAAKTEAAAAGDAVTTTVAHLVDRVGAIEAKAQGAVMSEVKTAEATGLGYLDGLQAWAGKHVVVACLASGFGFALLELVAFLSAGALKL